MPVLPPVLTIALLPLVGVMIGAVLQYAFGRRLDAGKLLLAQRVQAYIDFVRAVSTLAPDRAKDQATLAADARMRICLYGSLDVVRRLEEFCRTGSAPATKAGRAALVGLVRAMRQDVTDNKAVPRRDSLALILFDDAAGPRAKPE